ncbi:MBL fold metallo-hydrolase [Clostridium sp. MCC353]|uniref:MBL fold metallo-hydrolase n=1 Tax=Clostridium sp. MCC353 TaxID=2592646 RepID=UPI001C020323|nr:MBL fold metallo-hydrolase [Clostridium sp. MCC353]MBT9775511.1 MBL fold metallo-hydrolase [Clostridium sp. MCC353]
MIVSALKIRSFHAGGAHEIQLSNGKVILIDPFFRDSETEEHTKEEITRVDYILVTHTHFDHEIDLGYFVRKFRPKVFTGALSAMALMKYHRIPFDDLYPVFPGQKFTLEDFTLEAWQAKHNPSGGRICSTDQDITKKELGIEGHFECDTMGSIESLDYLITTNQNFRCLMASGQTVFSDLFDISREKRPNVVLRQAGVRKSGGDLFSDGQVPAGDLAQLFVKYGAQVVIPFHMDVLCKKWGEEKTSDYFMQVKGEMEKLEPGCTLLYPEAWKWYGLGIGITED